MLYCHAARDAKRGFAYYPLIYGLMHHAEAVALNRDSYGLKDRDLGRVPTAPTNDPMDKKVVSFRMRPPIDQISISNAVDRVVPDLAPHAQDRLRWNL